MRSLRKILPALLLACWLPAAFGCKPNTTVQDLAGAQVDPLASAASVRVLVFVSSECPISNQYAPELRRLVRTFEPKGARFWLVYPSERDTPAKIRTHLAAFDFGMRALRDAEHVLVRY